MEAFKVFATFSLVDLISGPLGRIRDAMRHVDSGVRNLNARFGRLALAMAPVGLAAGAVVGGLALLAMSGLATEKALGELATLGVKDLAAVEETARQASNSMAGLTKDQFITAAYDIKSGISSLSDEGVASFTALAAKTAQATKATVADMTNLGATAYGIHKRMYAQLSDSDFGAMLYAGVASSVQAFKTTGAAMNQAMSNLGAAATQAKRPLEEQLAVLGTLQNSMEASVAGTAYKSFFRDASKGFKELGIQATDAFGQMKSMPDLLAALEKKLGPLNQTKLDSITKAFGSETGAMIQNLLGKSDELRASITTVGEAMKGGTGFLKDMAASMNAGLGPSLALLRQRTQNLREELAKRLAPVLTVIVAGISRFVLRMQEAAKSPFVGFLLKAVGAISAALVALTALSGAMWFFTAVGPMLAKALLPLKAALLGLGWPVLAVIAVFGLLYVAYRKNLGGIADTINRWAKRISLVVQGVIAIFQSLKGSSFEVKGALAEEIHAAGLEGLVTSVARIVYRIKEYFAGLWDALDFGPMLRALEPAFAKFGELVDLAGSLLALVFGASCNSAGNEARALGEIVGGALTWVFEALGTSISVAINIIDAIVASLMYLVALFQGDFTAAAQLAQRVWDDLCAAFTSITDLFGVTDALRDAWNGVVEFFTGIDLSECGRAILNTLIDGITSAAGGLVDTVKGVFSDIRDMLPFSDAKTGPLSTLTLSGSRLMTTLGEGVTQGAGGLLQKVGGALSGVKDTVGRWWDKIAGAIVPPVEVPDPSIPAPETTARAAEGADRPPNERGRMAGGQTTITVHIENITLPGVQNGQGFVDELQNLVTEYGVGTA